MSLKDFTARIMKPKTKQDLSSIPAGLLSPEASTPATVTYTTTYDTNLGNVTVAVTIPNTTPAIPPPVVTPVTYTYLSGQSGPQSAETGPYTFQVNEWDSSAAYTIEYSYPPCNFKVTSSSISNATNGAPGVYSSFYNGDHFGTNSASSQFPVAVSNIKAGQVTTSASGSYSGVPGYWDFSYDIWLCDTPGFDNNHRQELMIWLADSGTIQPAGSAGATYSIGGLNWVLWSSGAGNTATFVCTTTQTSVTNLDLLPFIQRLVSNGITSSSYYLIDVECGFEIWQNGTGLTLNSFSVNNATASTASDVFASTYVATYSGS